MKTWKQQLIDFKKKALLSLNKRIWLSHDEPTMGIVFYLDNNKHYDKLCFHNQEWIAFDKKNNLVKALNINTETLMSMIDEIHNKYTFENLDNLQTK